MRWYLLLGRLLFGGFFLWAAATHILNVKPLTDALAAHSVPYPELALTLSTALLALGGASIVVGFMPRAGLAMIVLFLVPATFIMHPFWSVADASRGTELAMFMKNVALLGAAMGLLAVPVPWPLSLDAWLTKRGGYGGDGALAAGWRRLTQGTRHRLQHWSARWRPEPKSLVRAAPSGDDATWTSGGWVIHQQSMWSPDGSYFVRRVRARFSG